jgi:hypothetical protein
MKKALIVGGVVVGAVLLARRARALSCEEFSVAKMLERMPDTAPPKWMFTNITAIRQNTDRILAKMETRLDE